MTDLTPAEHRTIRAKAWLMYCRYLRNPYTPVTAQTEAERPKPPDPVAVHPHKRSWHYRPASRKPNGGNR